MSGLNMITYCPVCRKTKFWILTSYNGKLMCEDCKAKKIKEDLKKGKTRKS